MVDSFGASSSLLAGQVRYGIFRIDALATAHDVARLPFSLKVLLENLLRNENGVDVTAAHIEGSRGPSLPRRSPSLPPGCSRRTSPACRPWWTSRRCAMRCAHWVAIRLASIRSRPSARRAGHRSFSAGRSVSKSRFF